MIRAIARALYALMIITLIGVTVAGIWLLGGRYP